MSEIEILPHQQRVIDEKRELEERVKKLRLFMFNPGTQFNSLPDAQQSLMREQYVYMVGYLEALNKRLAAWGLS